MRLTSVAGGLFVFVRSPEAMLFLAGSQKHSPVSFTVSIYPAPSGLSFRGGGVKSAGNAAWLNCYE